MKNKDTINRIKNAAELAWAAYGYYDLIGKKFAHKKEYGNRTNTKITLHDILDITYKDYETQDSTFFNTENLNGDFTPTQAKRFFERYDLLIHQPNTHSGFSATLFGEKRKQKNAESKLLKELQCFF